ncbi:MAG: TRAP transporter small permease [Gammaproteobacteria bacterium]
MLSWFTRLNAYLEKLEDILLPLLFVLTLLLAVLQIIMRNVFSSGLVWAGPLLKVMVLWLGMLGALYATRKRRHIKIDILRHYLKPSLRKITSQFVYFVSGVICLLCSYYSFTFLLLEYTDGTSAFMQVPAWTLESIIPFSLFIMALRFIYFAFNHADME